VVPPCGRILKDLVHIQSTTLENLEERQTAVSRHGGHFVELYTSKSLHSWTLHLISIKRLVVVQVAQLAGLTHSLATCEALMSKKAETVVNIIVKAHVQEKSTDSCACSALARVAVDHNDVFRVRFDPITGHFGNREEEVERWTMVIGPMESHHSPTKVAIPVIRGSLGDINNKVV
jgi:hypothetical protein